MAEIGRYLSPWRILLLSTTLMAGPALACEESSWIPPLREAARFQGANRHAEASAAYGRALQSAERCGPTSVYVGLVLNNYGSFEHSLGRVREAERLYRKALTILAPTVGRLDPLTLRATSNLAHLYLDTRRYSLAKAVLRETLAGQGLGSTDPQLALLWMCMAYVHTQEEAFSDAEEIYRRQIPVLAGAGEVFRESTAGALTELANLCLAAGRPAEAQAAASEALALLDRGPLFYTAGLVRTLNIQGAILLRTRKEAEAVPLLERALDALEDASLSVHPLAPDVLLNYAECLRRLGRKADARRVEKEAAARLAQLQEDYPTADTVEYSELLREAQK